MNKKHFEIIMPFTSDEFVNAWEVWLQYRQDIKKPYKSNLSVQAALKYLSKYPEHIAIEMLEQSIGNGWQGIFELKNNKDKASKIENIINEAAKGRAILKQMRQNEQSGNS